MLNFKSEVRKFQSINLNSLQESVGSLSENEKSSIILYNKAITNLNMNSEDIAIIELKKSIAMNPNFVEAMILLALCYIEIRDYAKAHDILNRVLLQEKDHPQALEYFEYINQKNPRVFLEKRKEKIQQETGSSGTEHPGSRLTVTRPAPLRKTESEPFNQTEQQPKRSTRTDSRINYNLRKYITGLMAGLVMASAILIPFIMHYSKKYNEAEIAFKVDQTKVDAASTDENESRIEALNEEIKKLKKEVEGKNSELEYYKNAMRLFQVRKLSEGGNDEAAADELLAIRNIPFKGVEKEELDALSQEVFNKAAYKVSNEGNQLFDQKKYPEAINKLKKIENYNPKWEYLHGSLYVLGRCYQESGDKKNALATYQKVISEFPNSPNAQYARMRIDEINAGQ